MQSDQPVSGLHLAPRVHVAESALRFAFSRSSGPGGQNVNKVNSKVELWVRIADLQGLHPEAADRLRILAGRRLTAEDALHLVSESSRSQQVNREDAIERLRELVLAAIVRPKKRRPTKPSRAAKQRRLEGKKRRSEVKAGRSSRPHD